MVKVYSMKKEHSLWNNKMAHTVQAAVDNLGLNALKASDHWYVKDREVNYYLPDIYAELFEEGLDGKKVTRALKPISDAVNLFSNNFEVGGVWTQDEVNKVAQNYKVVVEESDGWD